MANPHLCIGEDTRLIRLHLPDQDAVKIIAASRLAPFGMGSDAVVDQRFVTPGTSLPLNWICSMERLLMRMFNASFLCFKAAFAASNNIHGRGFACGAQGAVDKDTCKSVAKDLANGITFSLRYMIILGHKLNQLPGRLVNLFAESLQHISLPYLRLFRARLQDVDLRDRAGLSVLSPLPSRGVYASTSGLTLRMPTNGRDPLFPATVPTVSNEICFS